MLIPLMIMEGCKGEIKVNILYLSSKVLLKLAKHDRGEILHSGGDLPEHITCFQN